MTPPPGLAHAFELLGSPGEVLLVDTRSGAPSAWTAAPRSFFAGGYRVRPLAGALPEDPREAARALGEDGRPVVLVFRRDRPPADDLVEAFYGSLDEVLAVAEEEPATPPEVQAVDVTFRGRTAVRVNSRLLPFAVDFDLPAGREDRWVLEVAGTSPADPLPPPTWFRVAAPGRGRVRVDVEPDATGARWSLAYEEGGEIERLPAPPRGSDGDGLRLALVLDRTCPDAEHTLAAAKVGLRGATGHGTMNRGIRRALGKALPFELPGNPPARVLPYWVADVADEHLHAPPGLDLPDQPHGALGEVPVGEVAPRLETLGYSPGLDLWDPLELALAEATDELATTPGADAAVLLVGNSPPTHPTQEESPLAALPARLGLRATWRASNDLWHRTLFRLEGMHVPVCYLFLTHPEARGRAAEVEEGTRRALEACVPLVARPATAEGVREGVRDALALLRERVTAPSLVGVRA